MPAVLISEALVVVILEAVGHLVDSINWSAADLIGHAFRTGDK